jgi:elongator complex protein 2
VGLTCGNGLQAGSGAAQLAELTALARRQTFVAAGATWVARSHSTLLGHEDWVHSVAWEPRGVASGGTPRLLSASMDRTMMVWQYDKGSGVWMCVSSMGDAGTVLNEPLI